MRNKWIIAAIAMALILLTAGGLYSRQENKEPYTEVGKGVAAKRVKIIDSDTSKEVRSRIVRVRSENKKLAFIFNGELPKEMDGLVQDDIFILPAKEEKQAVKGQDFDSMEEALITELIDGTFIGKVEDIRKEGGQSLLLVSTPRIDEVFTELKINVDQPLKTSSNARGGFLPGLKVQTAYAAVGESGISLSKEYVMAEKDQKGKIKIQGMAYPTNEGILIKELGVNTENLQLIKIKDDNGLEVNGKVSISDIWQIWVW